MVDSPTIITPYGGRLVDLMAPPEELSDLAAHAKHLPSPAPTRR